MANNILHEKQPKALIGNASQSFTTSYFGNSDFFITSRPKQTSFGVALYFISNISNTKETTTPYDSNNSRALTIDYNYKLVKANSDVPANIIDLLPNKQSLVWPAGSTCRYLSSVDVKTIGNDQNYFAFSDTSRTRFTTLDSWESDISSRSGVTIDKSKTISTNYGGISASIPVRALFDSTTKKTYLASLYNGLIHNTDLYLEGKITVPETDKPQCREYNQVAADFIESQIK